VNDDGNRFDPNADVIVGTYEDRPRTRTGKDLGDIGTVVIDEVHTLKEGERGHRLDGLISRLKYYSENRMETHEGYGGTQFVYLSATVGTQNGSPRSSEPRSSSTRSDPSPSSATSPSRTAARRRRSPTSS